MLLSPGAATAYIGNVRVTPQQPIAGKPIAVVVSIGDCHAFVEDVGAFREVKRVGNRIDVTIEGFIGFGICEGWPVYDRQFPIGTLPPGAYELHFHFLDGLDSTEVGSVVFDVVGTHAIPSLGTMAMMVMVAGIAVVVFGRRHGTRMLLAVMPLGALLVPEASAAAEPAVYVLLKAVPNNVSAEDIVEGYDFSSGQPAPLAALNAQPALGASYLIPTRAKGRFVQYLASRPDAPRSRLERFIVVQYGSQADIAPALSALAADAAVEYAAQVEEIDPVAVSGGSTSIGSPLPTWRQRTNVDLAWSSAGGWALVAALDNGIATNHGELKPFSEEGNYLGGNFLPALSADAGRTGDYSCILTDSCIEPDVDELEPLPVLAGSPCDEDGDGWATPVAAGHGTHVAGLIAANAENGGPIRGACRHCGVAVWRVAQNFCDGGKLRPVPAVKAIDSAMTHATDLGSQVINQSFGRSIADQSYCANHPLAAACQALAHAAEFDVLTVAAAGNDRSAINFPASQLSVVAAAGADGEGKLWDRSPGSTAQCPSGLNLGAECGSNYTINAATDRHQEILAPADSVYSSFYPGMTWNASTDCSDAADGNSDDGAGLCTGTSMSAPIVSGIAGILRSINPLVPVGEPDNPLAKAGIRSVVRRTTLESKFGKAWDSWLGFGNVDAAAAARAMLGMVGGQPVRNRAIPLFALYSTDARDHAAVATPQRAVSIGLTQAVPWSTRGASVAGYPNFAPASLPADLLPKAPAYVLSTEFRTRSSQPALRPLFLLDRPQPWPAGCTPGTTGCASFHNDHLLVSTVADLEQAHGDGYRLLGRQGYVFARCAPEPACMPAGSAKLYRQCKPADDDCAVFIESEKASFEADGYTATYPSGSDAVLGYAFPNADADGDALIDGFERMIGTNPASADSDGDGAADGVEYPLAGVPASDPCDSESMTCDLPPFFDGFE